MLVCWTHWRQHWGSISNALKCISRVSEDSQSLGGTMRHLAVNTTRRHRFRKLDWSVSLPRNQRIFLKCYSQRDAIRSATILYIECLHIWILKSFIIKSSLLRMKKRINSSTPALILKSIFKMDKAITGSICTFESRPVEKILQILVTSIGCKDLHSVGYTCICTVYYYV